MRWFILLLVLSSCSPLKPSEIMDDCRDNKGRFDITDCYVDLSNTCGNIEEFCSRFNESNECLIQFTELCEKEGY